MTASRRTQRRTSRGGFTLLETIVALGILAVGASAALAVLVAATVAGRRAEHTVSATLLAESVLTDVEAEIAAGSLTTDGLEAVSLPRRARGGAPVPGPARAVPSSDLPRAPDEPVAREPGVPRTRAPERDLFAGAPTFWLVRDATSAADPDSRYDVAITPIGGAPDDPWEFLVEVTVHWKERGTAHEAAEAGVFVRRTANRRP